VTLARIDLETTGLDPRKDRVLEVACIVTDDALNELGRWHEVVRPYGWEVGFEKGVVEPVVYDMHKSNGLFAAVADSRNRRIDCTDVRLSLWLAPFCGTGHPPPQLAGSSIHVDRAFMEVHLPAALAWLHYRHLDVSTLNEMARRFWPDMHAARPRSDGKAHRALADIEQSIALARYYSRRLCDGNIAGWA
jgi:oligoribonuclease